MDLSTAFATFGIVGRLALAGAAELEAAPGSAAKPVPPLMQGATGLDVRLFLFSGLK